MQNSQSENVLSHLRVADDQVKKELADGGTDGRPQHFLWSRF
jgi:hypothetical protein